MQAQPSQVWMVEIQSIEGKMRAGMRVSAAGSYCCTNVDSYPSLRAFLVHALKKNPNPYSHKNFLKEVHTTEYMQKHAVMFSPLAELCFHFLRNLH
jgi:hypothetical protein